MKSKILLGESAKSLSLHPAIEPEGLRNQGSSNAWNPTCRPTWHAMDNISWSTRFCVKPTSKITTLDLF